MSKLKKHNHRNLRGSFFVPSHELKQYVIAAKAGIHF